MDAEFTSFTEEASMPARPPSHIEKTYDRRYIIDVGASGHDYWVSVPPTLPIQAAEAHKRHSSSRYVSTLGHAITWMQQ